MFIESYKLEFMKNIILLGIPIYLGYFFAKYCLTDTSIFSKYAYLRNVMIKSSIAGILMIMASIFIWFIAIVIPW